MDPSFPFHLNDQEMSGSQDAERKLDAGRKLDVHKTLRRRPGRLQNVLHTFSLRPAPKGSDQKIS